MKNYSCSLHFGFIVGGYVGLMIKLNRSLAPTLFFILAGFRLFAAEAEPGQIFPAFQEMQDQHEKAYPWPKNIRHVVIAFTMGTGKSANGYIAKQESPATYLPKHNAVFVANIHGMPVVGRLFAMPKMRKYPHRIMLADAEGLLDDLPQKDGKATVFDLDAQGKIQAIRFWDPNSEELSL